MTLRPQLWLALAVFSRVTGSAASPADGAVIGTTKIFDKGPAASRFNLVLLGEGYTASQQARFAQDAQDFVDFLVATPPFSTNCSAFNVYRVDVASDESGADDPAACGGSGATVDTYFDATFCADGVIQRLLGANDATAAAVLAAQVPEFDQALMIVNSSIYGGSGGSIGVTSVSGAWQNIAIHEFGHAAFGLADEYEYLLGCPDEPGHDSHPAAEPVEANVTVETNPLLLKWSDLIAGTTAVPTTTNANCDVCDTQADPFPGSQVTGLYEGAHYYHCDAFRPAFNCMMRNFSPFCAVCTRRILAVLDPFQPANTGPICDANGPYVAECSGATTEVQLDGNGSSDFDCDTLGFDWSGPFAGGAISGTMPTVSFSGTGLFDVALRVNDGSAAATCDAQVNVQDTSPPQLISPPDVVAECTAIAGTPVELGIPTVSDLCDAAVTVSNDAPAVFPVGNTLVTWTALDDSGNAIRDTQMVTVADTTPPDLTVSVSPTLLWPPNHKLVEVTANRRATDICDPTLEITLVSIASNEPDDGSGDGATDADIQGAVFGTDDGIFQLRSERRGGGGGRKYLVTYQAIDDSGNTASVEAQVKVPAKSRKDAARRARFGLLDAL